jgi:transposase
MGSKKRNFTEEFKKTAVELSNSTEKSLEELAMELGVGGSTLGKWRKKYSLDAGNTRKSRVLTPKSDEQEELIRIKKELERLRMENAILKKATALFAKDLS